MSKSKMSPIGATPEPDPDYQARDDHSTIMRAHEVIKDPKRMSAVHKLHKGSTDLFDFYKQKSAELADREKSTKKEPAENDGEE